MKTYETIIPQISQEKFYISQPNKIYKIKVFFDINKLKVDDIRNFQKLFALHAYYDHSSDLQVNRNGFMAYCNPKKIKKGVLTYYFARKKFIYFELIYIPIKINIIYNDMHHIKLNARKFCTHKVTLDRFDIVKNICIVMSKSDFESMIRLVLCYNNTRFYNLTKDDINNLNNYYNFNNNVIILECIYLPKILNYLLEYSAVDIRIYSKDCPINFYMHDTEYLLYLDQFRPSLIHPIFDSIKNKNIFHLNKYIIKHKILYMSDINAELLCLTDLTHVFENFYALFNSTNCVYKIPIDVWHIINLYLKKDFYYLLIIIEIYNKILYNKKDDIISMIIFNKLSYENNKIDKTFINL